METQDETQLGTISIDRASSLLLTPYLCVVHPVNVNSRIRLKPNHSIIIGRDDRADLTLKSDLVSRQHCRISMCSDGSFIVEDLGSTNGTRVDGEKVQYSNLTPVSRLSIGSFQLKIEFKHAKEILHEQELIKAASSDPLTGVANRAWFMEKAGGLLTDFQQRRKELSIIMVDIDKFKRINDIYGHPTGDACIQGVAKALEESKRQQDILARYGGEEFILCLPGSNEENAFEFCERARNRVLNEMFRFGDIEFHITISLGLCANTEFINPHLEDLIAAADKALYLSKENGRNRTTVFSAEFETV